MTLLPFVLIDGASLTCFYGKPLADALWNEPGNSASRRSKKQFAAFTLSHPSHTVDRLKPDGDNGRYHYQHHYFFGGEVMYNKVGEDAVSSTSKARVIVSAREGIIEIEGSEAFVADQLTRLKTVICQVVASGGKWRSGTEAGASLKSGSGPLAVQALEKFSNLYTQSDGRLRLLKDLPGNNMANKTVNAALLVAHAHALMGAEHTTLDTIRSVCKEHACHDSNNFSATLKREKELFVHSGSLHITLSAAGRERAATLASQLNHDS